jgi:uncharacterized RDD family membrane protein YckC
MTDLVTPAPLWRRFGAALYDSLLLVALWLSATWLLVLARDALGVAPDAPAWERFLTAFILCLGLAFFGWFWTHGGQTLGMLAWRLRVRRDDGAPLRWPVAAIRYSVMLVCWGIVLTPILLIALPEKIAGANRAVVAIATGMLAIVIIASSLIDGRRRLPHDRLSSSEVVLLPSRRARANAE